MTVYFTNQGSSPLHKLKVASSNPKCFVLGSSLDRPHSNTVYNISDKSSDSISVNCDFSVKRVLDIVIPDGVLHSKSTMSVQLWIRGNDIGGNHQVDFLFYYELAENLEKPK